MKIFWFLAWSFFIFWTGLPNSEPSLAQGQPKATPRLSQEKGKDPFLLPPGIRLIPPGGIAVVKKEAVSPAISKPAEAPVSKPEEIAGRKPAEPPSPPLFLKAILISERLRLAAINQNILTVGDTIQSEKILEIHKDRVVLGKGDKKRSLYLSQSPVRLMVEEKASGEKQ